MLTPNPENRPDIYEIEELLETWNDHQSIQINSEAQQLKMEEQRKQGFKIKKSPSKIVASKVITDISEQEIKVLQKKMKEARIKEKQKVINSLTYLDSTKFHSTMIMRAR